MCQLAGCDPVALRTDKNRPLPKHHAAIQQMRVQSYEAYETLLSKGFCCGNCITPSGYSFESEDKATASSKSVLEMTTKGARATATAETIPFGNLKS
jgi:hypothetical protein